MQRLDPPALGREGHSVEDTGRRGGGVAHRRAPEELRRDPVGKLRAKSFAREREAKAYLREVQAAMGRGSYMDESQGKITFEEYAEHYFALAQRRLARTSYARDVSYLNTHVLPQWGRVPLGRITKVAVERWIVELGAEAGDDGRTLAPGTVEKIYQTFRKVMVAAVSDERIPRLPCPDHPPIARAKRKVVRFLTSAELHRLAGSVAELLPDHHPGRRLRRIPPRRAGRPAHQRR